jgi:hypothetical protein
MLFVSDRGAAPYQKRLTAADAWIKMWKTAGGTDVP